MEAVKEESKDSAKSEKSKLRYPHRSVLNQKGGRSSMAHAASYNSKRAKAASNVSESVSVLKTSEKDKSAKPPRRLSVPAESPLNPPPKSTSTITPPSRTATKRSIKDQGSYEKQKSVSVTPISTIRKKFSILSSLSYWSSQIKLSESAAKHSISLGFFKLALESGCEPLPRMRDELISYIRRHNLSGLDEPLKELLTRYRILEDMDQLQVSETCSHVPGVASGSSSSTGIGKKLKPRSPSSVKAQTSSSSVTKPVKRSSPKKILGSNDNGSVIRNSTMKPNTANSTGSQKKSTQMSKKRVDKKEKVDAQIQVEIFGAGKGDLIVAGPGPVETLPCAEMELDNKENKFQDTPKVEDISLTEEVII